jgi:hypothetical protein
MSVVLIGSNPGLLLYADQRPVGYASVWSVDWSRWGGGAVIIAATESGWLTAAQDEHFARILLDRFTRNLPEAAEFAWDNRVHHVAGSPRIDLDPAKGMRASAPGMLVSISEVLDRRHFTDPAFRLGSATVGLSNVYLPCAVGTLTLDGEDVPGTPVVDPQSDPPSSTAYLALAEVWVDTTGALGLPSLPRTATERKRHLRSLRPSL